MSFGFKTNYPQIARESGFKLRQFRDGPLDWRLVGSMEIDRILREQQFEHIDAVLFHLSEAPLTSMLDSNVLDSGVAKYFTLSQLALQYLIFCRKFLDESVRTLRGNLIELETQNDQLKTTNQEHSNEIMQLHKKISQIEAINEIVFPCHVCTKNFVSNDALNVHLSKKHLKSPSIDIQGRDNDRTLINTIKLELEIKQLKERLNIAEKDIRQTVESKRGSPREVPKLSSSTQIEIPTRSVETQSRLAETDKSDCKATKDVGTQSNLFETKESDCTEDKQGFDIPKDPSCSVNHAEANKNEIISELQEKISKLETWQERHSNGNEESINEITQKLSEITKSFESQRKQDAENLTKAAKDAILSSISSNQIIPSTSTDELHGILSNMFSEALQVNSEKMNQIITRIEKTYEKKLAALEVEISKRQNLESNQKFEKLESQFQMKMDSIKLGDESNEDKVSSAHASRRTYSIVASSKDSSNSNTTGSEGSSTDASQNSESKISLPKTKRKTSEHPKAITEFEKKLELYGLNAHSKSISSSEAANISARISEQRNSLKKVYPRFYATRNRLKKFVDLLTSKKQLDSDMSPNPDSEVKIPKQDKDLPLTIDGTRAFKKRLEKILSSPIRKPTSYVSKSEKKLIKPVPLPRKHVMFYNEDDVSSEDEASPRSKSSLRNKL